MRRRLAIPLIAAIGFIPWYWFRPEPPPQGLPARLVSVVEVPQAGDWVGGLSGLELTPAGDVFYVVTDRGHLATGRLIRNNGVLTDVEIEAYQGLKDRFGDIPEFPDTDAEGLALEEDGRLYVSFEHAHRVLYYDTWDASARWPSYTRAWRALSNNKGLEALAVAPDGTLFAIPELISTGAWESLVYRRKPRGDWVQAFTVPVNPAFSPVGADIGPDGRFYLLERGIYPFGFFSRVRAMEITETGFGNSETVFQSRLFEHGNLEGLAVWRDPDGAIRLTMVSDDNFLPFLPGDIVEYVLDDRVALPAD